MTDEKAREVLKQIRKKKCVSECDYDCKLYESETFCLEEKVLDMAIKALVKLEKIQEIINIDNSVIQEDVIKYKMICEVIANDT